MFLTLRLLLNLKLKIFRKIKPKLNSTNIQYIFWLGRQPWTLPSNTALAVGRDIEYVLVKTFNQYTFEPINIILARPLLENNSGKNL
jgi:isoleucyl-tRNA synthetase